MAKSKRPTRNEHFLPKKSHLDQFTDKSVVNVYRFASTGKKDFIKTAKHFKTSPKAIGFEKDLYERPDLPQNTVENNLANIEGAFGIVLENKIKKHLELTDGERVVVAQFIGLLQHRTPARRDHLNSLLDEIAEKLKMVAAAHGKPEAANKKLGEIEEAKMTMFTETMAISQEVDHWSALDICFLEVDETVFSDAEFITSDHPVTLNDFADANGFYSLHPLNKTAENIAPLTPKIAILGNRVGITGYKKVGIDVVREINQRTLRSSVQMVIAKTKLDDEETERVMHHFPQSIILKLLDLPDGRMEEILKKIKRH